MKIKIVEGRTVQGITPVLYLYADGRYLGSLFCTDDERAAVVDLLTRGVEHERMTEHPKDREYQVEYHGN